MAKAMEVFVDTNQDFIKAKKEKASWPFHQRCLNFMGSLVGRAAVYYYIFSRLYPLNAFSFKAEDGIIILIALLGIAGFLP